VNALRADDNGKLVAMNDLVPDQLERSLKSIGAVQDVANRVDVPPEKRFTGFDGFIKLLDSGIDLVVLASPPHFRPMQVEEAAKRGKHMFVTG
jgi:myo-inositol 2-dehydrogenase/D-chiro-inositol 1-dehydrogenase